MHFFDFLNPLIIIQTVGLIGVILIIFAESGLFFGFFLPGDSLLFTAGLLASQGYFSIWLLIISCCIAAIVGDSVGYAFGKKVGPALFSRPKSTFFNPKRVEQAKAFYDRYGKKTLILARFIPAIRTFAPIVAGIVRMDYKTFLAYNIAGGIGWVVSMSVAGYFLGSLIPDIDKYILPIVLLIIAISFIPVILEVLKARRV